MNTYNINAYARTVAATYNPYLGRTAAVLAGICTLSVFLYGIFLLEAVIHTSNRTTAQRDLQEIASKLSVLETQYLAQTKNLTPDHARALGYVSPSSVTVISTTVNSRTLSLR